VTEQRPAEQKEYRSRLLDIIRAWLPVLTVVVGALWGLYTYIASQKAAEELRAQQAKAAEAERAERQGAAERQRLAQSEREDATRRIEAQKPFLTKQLELYFETASVVGKLVTLPREDGNGQYQAAKLRFYALYWSELSMVEHPNVEAAMAEFREALEAYDKEGSDVSKAAIQNAAYKLAHEIRDAIETAWSGADQRPTARAKWPRR
jgi:hypothetical protein